MVKLRPMKEAEFQVFMEFSARNFAAQQVQAGYWDNTQASIWLSNNKVRQLPLGLHTPDHYFFRILNIQEIPVGYLWAILKYQDQGRYVYLNDLVIQDAHRRKGYARSALQSLENWAQEQHVHCMRLFVHHANREALSLYIKSGFYALQESPGFYEKTFL